MTLKTKTFIFATVASSCSLALAGPCASLSYDELQDMTVQELTQEACTARSNASQSRAEAFNKVMSRYAADPEGADLAEKEADRCDNELKRILRVLGKKGVDTTAIDYAALCKPQKP